MHPLTRATQAHSILQAWLLQLRKLRVHQQRFTGHDALRGAAGNTHTMDVHHV